MPKELLYLSKANVEDAGLPMSEIIETVEEAFVEKGEGRVEMPPKPGIHPKQDAFIHAMPALIPRMHAAGIKWISGYPENYLKKLPYITGLLILNDPETGIPICVMDATWITAKRTGAATAVAAKYLARKDSGVFGILGCGVQGRANLEAILALYPDIKDVRAYDISESARSAYASEMRSKFDVEVTPVSSPLQAVSESDIVVTAGPILKHPSPSIEPNWFKEGGFACSLDFDSYWTPQAMHAMNKFCTDDMEQLKYYRSVGYFADIPEAYADLEELVTKRKPGRENDNERTMAMNLGLALEDMAVAKKVYDTAKRKGMGVWLDL